MQETWVQPVGQEDSLEMEMAPHSNILRLGNPMDRRAWQATVHGITKEPDTTWQLNSNNSLQCYLQKRKHGTCYDYGTLGETSFVLQTIDFFFCIGVQPINSVVQVSGGQQRDAAVHIHGSNLPQSPRRNFLQMSPWTFITPVRWNSGDPHCTDGELREGKSVPRGCTVMK